MMGMTAVIYGVEKLFSREEKSITYTTESYSEFYLVAI